MLFVWWFLFWGWSEWELRPKQEAKKKKMWQLEIRSQEIKAWLGLPVFSWVCLIAVLLFALWWRKSETTTRLKGRSLSHFRNLESPWPLGSKRRVWKSVSTMAHLPSHLQWNEHLRSPEISRPWSTHCKGPQSFLPEVEAGGTFTCIPEPTHGCFTHIFPPPKQGLKNKSQHQWNKIPFPSHCTTGGNQHCQRNFLLSQWNRKESGNKERIYLPWGAGGTLVYHRSFWIIFSSTSFFELPFSGWGGRRWWWGSLSSNSLWRCSRIHPDDHWSWSLFRKRAALLTNSLDPRNMDTWKDAAWPKCPHSVFREGKGHPTQCLVFFLPGSLTSWSSLCFWD